MKYRKHAISIIICLLGSASISFSQSYNTSMGLRFGGETGMTIQQRVGKKTTLEGIAQYNNRYEESTVTLMIQQHMPLLLRRFNVYTGIGGHHGWTQNRELPTQSFSGLSFVAGFELTLGRMNLSWDYKPMVNVSGPNSGLRGQTAFSVRYVLVKRKSNPVDLKFWQWGDPKQKAKKKKKRQRKRERKKRKRA